MNTLLTVLWDKHRTNRRVRLKRRRCRQYIPRPRRDAKELVEYLRAKQIRTTGQLRARREPTGPTVPDYIRTFGTWNEAVRQAFGPPPPRIEISVCRENIIDIANHLNIHNREDYVRQRSELPSVVPSLHQVRRHFETFGELMDEVAKRSVDLALGKYLELRRKLGDRTPTADECRQWKVDLVPLNRLFGNKRNLDGFLKTLSR